MTITQIKLAWSGAYALDPHHWQGGWFGKQIYEYQVDLANPLTFTDASGRQYRADNHHFTDLGSILKSLQIIAPIWFAKDRFPRSYCFHDSAYAEGGLFMPAPADDGEWTFRAMTRSEIDSLLYDMIRAEGGSTAAARLIYAGVRAGGWGAYHASVPSERAQVL